MYPGSEVTESIIEDSNSTAAPITETFSATFSSASEDVTVLIQVCVYILCTENLAMFVSVTKLQPQHASLVKTQHFAYRNLSFQPFALHTIGSVSIDPLCY